MTMEPTVFSEGEWDQINAYADRLAEVMSQEVKQTDTDRLIQNSAYGYALKIYTTENRRRPEGGAPLLTPYHVENNVPADPVKQMVVVASQSDLAIPVISDDPAREQSDYLHHAYAEQSLGNVGCTIRISDRCTNGDQDHLFFDCGEICIYWSCCSTCHTWLAAMARAEREPLSRQEDGKPDVLRKAKHILEVLKLWGDCSQDLSDYMRDRDPVDVARLVIDGAV